MSADIRRHSWLASSALLLVLLLVLAGTPRAAGVEPAVSGDNVNRALDSIRIDLVYRQAQRAFLRGEFDKALPMLRRYAEVSLPYEDEEGRLLGVLDQIAQILLREKKAPDRAIAFFSGMLDDPRLDAVQREAVSGWLASAEEWKQAGALPTSIRSPDRLFELGKRYWRRGADRTGEPAARADLIIATSYLLAFIREHDGDPRIPEALYMVGHARSYSLIDPEYWTGNLYLRGAIQRAPRTPLAQTAWQRLHDSTQARYRELGHDALPASIQGSLEVHRKLAFGPG